jgi:hypothetical protein
LYSRTAVVGKRAFPRHALAVAASGHMRDARWTPWELGLAAGLKEIAKIALFPVALSIRFSCLAVLPGSMRVLLQEWLVI